MLKLLCGRGFRANELDLLERITGMACAECSRHVPLSEWPEWPRLPEAAGYIYQQLADHLSFLITHGWLPAGKPLPAEGRLAQQYGVSLGTARHATQVLRSRELVVTLPSKGHYVRARPMLEYR